MQAPTNKTDYYRRYAAGEFGNRPRAWATVRELRESGYTGNVTVRSAVPGGPCRYGVPVAEVLAPPPETLSGYRFNESMPDDRLSLQGNVFFDPGLKLEYSRVPGVGHRQAVSQPLMMTASGLLARSLLRVCLWPRSLEDLDELIAEYGTDCVIEFSAYDTAVGVCPHRNTVFWEVRAY